MPEINPPKPKVDGLNKSKVEAEKVEAEIEKLLWPLFLHDSIALEWGCGVGAILFPAVFIYSNFWLNAGVWETIGKSITYPLIFSISWFICWTPFEIIAVSYVSKKFKSMFLPKTKRLDLAIACLQSKSKPMSIKALRAKLEIPESLSSSLPSQPAEIELQTQLAQLNSDKNNNSGAGPTKTPVSPNELKKITLEKADSSKAKHLETPISPGIENSGNKLISNSKKFIPLEPFSETTPAPKDSEAANKRKEKSE